jgi:quercetin dioxygenase-like cupin family protein
MADHTTTTDQLPDEFADHRGLIRDLLAGPIDAITQIDTVAGAVRGNHVHHQTIQWTYVVSGRLRVVHVVGGVRLDDEFGPGQLLVDAPGVPHAWQAVTDCRVLVFTRGPRSGRGYESDTYRLVRPLL